MKYCAHHPCSKTALSHPARGAWIEIPSLTPPAAEAYKSHPARGAWIEMSPGSRTKHGVVVAPRKGCVD